MWVLVHLDTGEIEGLFPDEWVFGTAETLPPAQGGRWVRARLLRADGVTPIWSEGLAWMPNQRFQNVPPKVAAARAYLQAPERNGKDGRNSPALFYRAWRFLLNNLPAGVQSELNQTGYTTRRWLDVRSFIERRLDGTLASTIDLE